MLPLVYSFPAALELRRIHYGTTASTAHLLIWVGKDAGNFRDLMNRRPVAKEFLNRPELFRDNGPLEKALSI